MTKNLSVTQPYPMKVYFSALPVPEQNHIPVPVKTPVVRHDNPGKLPVSPITQAAQLAAQPDATAPSTTTEVFNLQPLLESAKNIAQNESHKIEQEAAVLKNKKLNSPVILLDQYLRQGQKEIHLANGMLKIFTKAGAICFQPVPVFARDRPGLYGIPITCP